MDELEWLKENSPPTRPSRATSRRHRTQLRAAIATEGADGTRPRRPHRGNRSRHRVLLTTTVVIALCAVGAVVVALTADGGDGDGKINAASGDTSTTTATARTECTGPTPRQLAVPAGFGSPVDGAGPNSSPPHLAGQQVTHWTSGTTTIEQRWPADEKWAMRLPKSTATDGSFTGASEGSSTVGKDGVARRTVAFTVDSQQPGCSSLQVTVSGADPAAVDPIVEALTVQPFVSTEPLVTTTRAAASAPPVVACEGVVRAEVKALAVPVVATVGGDVKGARFATPSDALTDFVTTGRTLARTGYEELQLDDASITYVKQSPLGVVTTVHVVPSAADGWAVADWQASGC